MHMRLRTRRRFHGDLDRRRRFHANLDRRRRFRTDLAIRRRLRADFAIRRRFHADLARQRRFRADLARRRRFHADLARRRRFHADLARRRRFRRDFLRRRRRCFYAGLAIRLLCQFDAQLNCVPQNMWNTALCSSTLHRFLHDFCPMCVCVAIKNVPQRCFLPAKTCSKLCKTVSDVNTNHVFGCMYNSPDLFFG